MGHRPVHPLRDPGAEEELSEQDVERDRDEDDVGRDRPRELADREPQGQEREEVIERQPDDREHSRDGDAQGEQPEEDDDRCANHWTSPGSSDATNASPVVLLTAARPGQTIRRTPRWS